MPSSRNAYVAVRLRVLRTAAGLTHEDLASEIGKSPETIARWEDGYGTPSTTTLQQVAAALRVQVADLLPLRPDDDTLHAWNR